MKPLVFFLAFLVLTLFGSFNIEQKTVITGINGSENEGVSVPDVKFTFYENPHTSTNVNEKTMIKQDLDKSGEPINSEYYSIENNDFDIDNPTKSPYISLVDSNSHYAKITFPTIQKIKFELDYDWTLRKFKCSTIWEIKE